MKNEITAVLAHPDADSFCAALYSKYATNISEQTPGVIFNGIDLYRDEYNPVMDLSELRRHIPIDEDALRHIAMLGKSRTLTLFFPDWWGAEPAILKGWLERCLRQDVAYGRGSFASPDGSRAASRGLLGELKLRIVICSDSSGEELKQLEELYSRRFGGVIGGFCSVESCETHVFSPLYGSRLKLRKSWLEKAADFARADTGLLQS